jgi:hypothetical protein
VLLHDALCTVFTGAPFTHAIAEYISVKPAARAGFLFSLYGRIPHMMQKYDPICELK